MKDQQIQLNDSNLIDYTQNKIYQIAIKLMVQTF